MSSKAKAASPMHAASPAAADAADASPARKSSAGVAPTAAAAAAPSSATTKKGGKGAPAPELAILEEALGMVSGENIAVEMVDYIVRRSCDKLTEHYAQQCAMQRTAKQAVDAIMQAIEWQLLGHDEGEKITVRNVLLSRDNDKDAAASNSTADADADASSSFTTRDPAPDSITAPNDRRRPALDLVAAKLSLPPTYNQLWRCEEEPQPADLDRWARGVIPTKAAPVSGHTSLTSLTMGATGAFTVHEALDENARSAAGSATPSQQIRSPSASQHVRGPARRAVDLARDLAAAAAATQPIKLEVVVSKEELAREKSRELELRRLEKKKKLAAEVAAVRAADDAERARLDRIQSDLRGKNYTFDARGNAILVTPAAPASFPAIQPAPKVVVKEQYLTLEEEEEIAKKAKRNRFKKGGAPTTAATNDAAVATSNISEEKTHSPPASPLKFSSLGLQHNRSKKKKSKASTEGFFDANAAQPSLMQTLTLAKGVTLKQGPNTKLYDPRSSTAATTSLGESGGIDHAQAQLRGLTRSEYLKKIEERRAVEARFQLTATPSKTMTATTTPAAATASTPAPASRSGVLVGSPGASLSRPSSSTRNQVAASAAVSASPRGSTQALHDDGDMDWAAQTTASSSTFAATASAASPSSSPLSPVATSASRPPRVSQTALFNRSIASDPLWGQNPPMSHAGSSMHPRPPHPSKPHGSPLAIGHRGPRDRPFVDTLSQPHLRQHMPPPPPGKVTGHGLELPMSPSGGSAAASNAASRSDEPQPTSPQKPFAKIPKPVTVTITDKAKLYFQ